MKKVYVTMTDKFMSGWGKAQGKINKLVFECDNFKQAEIVAENAEKRGDMKYINININKPYYNDRTHYTQLKTIDDYPMWYNRNSF